jgi:hypothetical protein
MVEKELTHHQPVPQRMPALSQDERDFSFESDISSMVDLRSVPYNSRSAPEGRTRDGNRQPLQTFVCRGGRITMGQHETVDEANIFGLAARSVVHFLGLAARRQLQLRRDRLGKGYRVSDGRTYQIFRETGSTGAPVGRPTVLVVAFRLRLIRSVTPLHWAFQRICILTTPFWSGFRGFRVKLWMVDPEMKSYLGIYDWSGPDNAQTYVDALVRVLRPLSTLHSVWYELYPDQDFETFLREREQ